MPSEEGLAEAYRLFTRNAKVQEVVEEAIEKIDDDEDETEVPADLEKRVRDYLVKHPTVRWDQAVQEIVDGKDEEEAATVAAAAGAEPAVRPLRTSIQNLRHRGRVIRLRVLTHQDMRIKVPCYL